ncbi:MAG TPA: NlpC/P60 family protein [Patescibacteria group bacterium]|nr:NlpC/P60 family protein [Patescibacteria group bacterium]
MKRVFGVLVSLWLILAVAPMAYAAENYETGDVGDEIAAIQIQLNNLGYDTGAADGTFGERTAVAVSSFQQDRGIDADGVVGAQTFRALMGRDIPVSRDASSLIARRVIPTALRYVGVPYSFGGTTPSGFDCSGFVRYVFAGSGISLPRMADEQYEVGQPVSYNRLQPGDLVFFTTYAAGVSHSGIYLGNGQFISATSSSGVAVTRIDDGYWGACYVGARRVI